MTGKRLVRGSLQPIARCAGGESLSGFHAARRIELGEIRSHERDYVVIFTNSDGLLEITAFRIPGRNAGLRRVDRALGSQGSFEVGQEIGDGLEAGQE